VVDIGHAGGAFAFDNEGPRHKVHLAPYALADRLVTNAEFRAFIDDGGYRRPELWLADGWAVAQAERWARPLYWQEDLAHAFTLHGMQPIEAHLPATHLSYYEADACARWAGARLPLEAEWEALAADAPTAAGTGGEPAAASGTGLRELFGACWQWTGSAYLPYPGYRANAGALGEYNGKFMANQFVLRGSSSVTPAGHARATYRNFFYPAQRWQFAGARLAKDL
jgi:ergothioneine biosynthesis protein EgtB